jgi:hypothetical protein
MIASILLFSIEDGCRISIFDAPPGFYNTDNTPSGDDLTHFLSILNNIKHWKKDSTMVPHPFGPISNWPPLQSSSTERGPSASHAFFSTFLLYNIFSLLLSTFYGKCSQSISRVSLEYEWIQEHPLICGQKKNLLADEPIGPDRIKELCSKVQIKTFNNPLFN